MDLYGVLGVPPTATSAEIDRAFRRLARRYHPGVNPGDRASEELYARIAEAHRVLMDAARRRAYDQGARGTPDIEATITFDGFDFAAPAAGSRAGTFSELFADVFQHAAAQVLSPSRGADIELAVPIAFRAAARGADVPLSIGRQERCNVCSGRGRVPRAPTTCPVCAGAGSQRWARGHLVFTKACEACGGGGRLEMEPCRTCGGVGTSIRNEVVTLTVPPGVEPGTRMAVPGRGHAGARGGPAGDLYVTLDVTPDPVFRREGRDLIVTVPVAVHEAALGARIEVPTLDGPARLRVPRGVQSGQRLRLRGQGIGSAGSDPSHAGDLVVELQIVLPPQLDERSQALIEEFGRRNAGDVRRHLFN